ncbi:hypothetical protein HPG69_008398 [Diceros bicornis minor]|uniref:Uncharacterized protein n=1 Tax=Diceros bicornis minor TaxID=77932 RepID=A0A7J7EPF6_DICBM|nr:hypothetical protein HPG69_008398 [Diceros bicornis minor]
MAPARPGGAQHGHTPLRGPHNFSSPQVGFLQVSSVLGPTSRNLLLPARPSSPRAANGRPRTPPPPAARVPRAALARAPWQTRLPAPAPAPLRPNLPPPKGPGARARQVWFELESAGGALWPRSLHPPGSPARGAAATVPGVTGWEPATPGAAAGWRAPTQVEPFFRIERGAPAQAPLSGAPWPPARSGGTRAAPTDGGGNRGGSLDFGAHGLQARWASAGRGEVPLSPPPPRAAAGIGGSASPGFPPPPSPAPGRTHREGRLQAQRQCAEPEPERRAPHAARTGGGLRGSGLRGLRGAPGRLSRLRCARTLPAMPSARLS